MLVITDSDAHIDTLVIDIEVAVDADAEVESELEIWLDKVLDSALETEAAELCDVFALCEVLMLEFSVLWISELI